MNYLKIAAEDSSVKNNQVIAYKAMVQFLQDSVELVREKLEEKLQAASSGYKSDEESSPFVSPIAFTEKNVRFIRPV